jgi:tRNA nucleotidyltransferase (CCA-adding enzyme)
VRRFLQRVDPKHAEAVLALAKVVRLAADEDIAAIDDLTERVRAAIARRPPLRVGDLAVNGQDVLATGTSGRAVGRVLDALLDHVIEYPEDNTRDALLPRLHELVRALATGASA